MIALLITVRSDRGHVLLDHLVLHLTNVVSKLALEIILHEVPYVEIVARSLLVQVFTGDGKGRSDLVEFAISIVRFIGR